MPQAKTRVGDTTSSRTEGTYEEVHAAIQELSRLMGVPSTEASRYSIPSGYSVYTYPNGSAPAAMAPPQNGVPQSPAPGWQNGQPLYMPAGSPANTTQPMPSYPGVFEPYTGLPACVSTGYSAWGPFLMPGSFR